MEDEIPKIPNLALTQLSFLIAHGPKNQVDSNVQKLVQGIKNDEMAPFYEKIVKDLNLKLDSALLSELKAKNAKELAKLDEKIKDAEENLGETEYSDGLIAKAQYLAKIGDKEKALDAYRLAIEKTGPLGHRIDMTFAIIRIGFFFRDNDIISKNIEKAKALINEGGDWDRRNRLKVYEGLHLMSIRNFKDSVNLFLDSLATFTSTEVLEYKAFVRYACLVSAITLPRPEFKKKVVTAPEVLEVIHDLPGLSDFINSYYNCKYAQFFQCLAQIEQWAKYDHLLHAHYRFYVREMKIRVYGQLLESYRSLTIEAMAKTFGISEEWLDNDLSRLISAGRVHAVIDKVGGVIVTNRPDAKNAQYQATIKQGDLLLTNIQKLSRVITI